MFTTNFDSYVTAGDSITCDVDGFTLTATVHHDDDSTPPWKREDGHGPVTGWMRKDAKRPGYRVLNVDGSSARFYDFAEAVKIARRDGWDAKPYGTGTAGERAARAAERDFEVLKAWCADEWAYCGIVVTVEREDVELGSASLWGVEYNYPTADDDDARTPNAYLLEVANELVDEALTAARAKLARLCPAA
jgi:hypothetical protein